LHFTISYVYQPAASLAIELEHLFFIAIDYLFLFSFSLNAILLISSFYISSNNISILSASQEHVFILNHQLFLPLKKSKSIFFYLYIS